MTAAPATTAPQRRCSVCGGSIKPGNRSGICSRSAACQRAARMWTYRQQKLGAPSRGRTPRPMAVANGCMLAIRECLVDLKQYAQRGIDQIDAIQEGVTDARHAKRMADQKSETVKPGAAGG